MTLRLCLLAYEFPTGLDAAIVSGEVKNPYTLATTLRAQGHAVTVLSVPYLTRTAPSGRARDCEGIPVIDVPEGRLRGVARTISRVRNLAAAVRSLDLSSFDVIHAQGPALGLAAAWAQRNRSPTDRLPIVTTAHGTNLPEADADRIGGLRHRVRALNARLDLLVDRRGFRCSDAVIAVSHFQRSEMASVYRIDPAVTHVIHNGVDLDRYAPPDAEPDRPIVLFVGRLVPKKGLQDLIRALAVAQKSVPDLSCVVVGGSATFDTYGRELRKLADREEVSDSITWLDAVPEARLPIEYRSATVGVFPSHNYESLPTVALEAMASGLPVIATRAWGTPEALGASHPGLVEQGDIGMLAATIVRFLRDHDLRAKVADQQFERVREFASEHLLRRHEALYKRVVGHA